MRDGRRFIQLRHRPAENMADAGLIGDPMRGNNIRRANQGSHGSQAEAARSELPRGAYLDFAQSQTHQDNKHSNGQQGAFRPGQVSQAAKRAAGGEKPGFAAAQRQHRQGQRGRRQQQKQSFRQTIGQNVRGDRQALEQSRGAKAGGAVEDEFP